MASTQLVVFALNNQEYGINVSAVNGILRSKKFTIQVLPGVPKSIEGIINLRGQIKYIFNLRNKFNLADEKFSDESKFIMLNVHDSISGWVVDEITDIVKIDDADIEQAPDFIGSLNSHYIKGIGKINDRMIIILDPEKVLSQEDFTRIETSETVE